MSPTAHAATPSPIPGIAPPPAGAERPFWSVMMPTYNPSHLFEPALRAVLDQDEGPGRMQIAVVDDRSPDVDVEAIVRRVAGDRIEYHRNPSNLGLAGNWNRCVSLARGRWTHLFHQDDLVSPGFYEALGRADREAPEAGAAFCQHAWIDDAGHWTTLSPLERDSAGVLPGWLERIADTQRVQCASIVVRRDVYESIGGYRTDLCMALDWEMWARIAAHYPVWYEPTVLAFYRYYEGTESTRLRLQGKLIPDIEKAIGILRRELPAGVRERAGAGMSRILRDLLMNEATILMREGDLGPALDRARHAGRLDRSLQFRLFGSGGLYRWAARIRLRRLLRIDRPLPPPATGTPL